MIFHADSESDLKTMSNQVKKHILAKIRFLWYFDLTFPLRSDPRRKTTNWRFRLRRKRKWPWRSYEYAKAGLEDPAHLTRCGLARQISHKTGRSVIIPGRNQSETDPKSKNAVNPRERPGRFQNCYKNQKKNTTNHKNRKGNSVFCLVPRAWK